MNGEEKADSPWLVDVGSHGPSQLKEALKLVECAERSLKRPASSVLLWRHLLLSESSEEDVQGGCGVIRL